MKTYLSSICTLKEMPGNSFTYYIQQIFHYRGQYLVELKKDELASLCIQQFAEMDEGNINLPSIFLDCSEPWQQSVTKELFQKIKFKHANRLVTMNQLK